MTLSFQNQNQMLPTQTGPGWVSKPVCPQEVVRGHSWLGSKISAVACCKTPTCSSERTSDRAICSYGCMHPVYMAMQHIQGPPGSCHTHMPWLKVRPFWSRRVSKRLGPKTRTRRQRGQWHRGRFRIRTGARDAREPSFRVCFIPDSDTEWHLVQLLLSWSNLLIHTCN